MSLELHRQCVFPALAVVGGVDGINVPPPARELGGAILAVHGVAAGDERHHAARTHLVDGFRKEIIVDAESQFVVRLVVDLVGYKNSGQPFCGRPLGGNM